MTETKNEFIKEFTFRPEIIIKGANSIEEAFEMLMDNPGEYITGYFDDEWEEAEVIDFNE